MCVLAFNSKALVEDSYYLHLIHDKNCATSAVHHCITSTSTAHHQVSCHAKLQETYGR